MRTIRATISVTMAMLLCGASVSAQTTMAPAPATSDAPSKFRSEDDNWLDVEHLLDEKFGFLPVALPITEPAVGYGAAAGLMFISQPLGQTRPGFGHPDITFAGGLGTENGTWGFLIADVPPLAS